VLSHADDWLTIHVGDCRAVLAELPAESVHCVVTSPPYYGLRDYGEPGQLGLEPTPDAYIANLVAVFREVRRVLRKDGTAWLNLGDSYYSTTATQGRNESRSDHAFNDGSHGVNGRSPALDTQVSTSFRRNVSGLKPKDRMMIPARVAIALQADGWWLRDEIVWSKPNPMPSSVTDRTTPAHEMVYLLTRSARYSYDADAVREPSAWVDAEGRPLDSWGRRVLQRVEGNGEIRRSGDVKGVPRTMGAAITDGRRNKRSVWTVATQPYPEAHFATFPEALIEPMIFAGCPERVCADCGAPWERVVEVTGGNYAERKSRGVGGPYNLKPEMYGPAGSMGGSKSTTTGWRPTCAHDAKTRPGVVLDPFGGSGTTGVVAQRLSRRAVLIDLSAEYMRQMMVRNRDIPMGLTG
jgi:DNA modification methylase